MTSIPNIRGLRYAVRSPRPRKVAMTNSTLELTYASKTILNTVCCCGKSVYPDSIWNPIIKVSKNRGTQGAQTWEYHASCVRAILDGEEVSSPGNITSLKECVLPNTRHCIVTGEKIKKGTKVIWFQSKHNTVAVTTRERVEEILASEPLPMSCAPENAIVDWIVRRSDLETEVVQAKFESKGGKKPFLRTATKILDKFEAYKGHQEFFQNKILNDPLGTIEEEVANNLQTCAYRLIKQSEYTVEEFLINFFTVGIDLPSKIALLTSTSENQRKLDMKLLETAISHGYQLFTPEGLVSLKSLPHWDEIASIPLKEENAGGSYSFNYNRFDEYKDLLSMLVAYLRNGEIDSIQMAEALVGERVLARQFCKGLSLLASG